MALEPQDLTGRAWESDLIDWRGFRIQQTQNWKMRLKIVDRLARGEWAEVFPNEAVMTENPYVMNMVQTGMEDHAKLVSEADPSVIYQPVKESSTAKEEAHLRESIANTHWSANDGDMMIPNLTLDIAGAGCAFVAVYADPDESEYPCYHKLNPRNCYPDVMNGKLLDLMVLEDLNIRTAARLFPDLGLQVDPKLKDHTVELLHYYSPEECIQAVVTKSDTGSPDRMYTVNRWKPRDKDGKPYLPVAFGQLNTFDGAFRGIYDQIIGSLMTKNRIIKQIMDYADQLIYAPWEEAGIMNPEAFKNVGPQTVFHRDPNVQGGGAIRVPPAGDAPQLLQYIDYLDREQRGGVASPSSRQGEISESQRSAAFVNSTQGALTSSVRNIQRIIANMREQLNVISFKQDEACLDFPKSLLYPIGKKNMYLPSRDIDGNYRNKVIYGAGAGLDRSQADVRVAQHVSGGLVSKQTGRAQIEYVRSPDAEEDQIELEQSVSILQQKLLATEDPMLLMKIISLQKNGMSFVDAVEKVTAEEQAKQQAAPPEGPPAPGAPGEMPGPEQGAAAEAQGLAAGATPAGQPLEFAPPPVQSVSVGQPSPARPLNMGGQ